MALHISDHDMLLIQNVMGMLNVLGDDDSDEDDLFAYDDCEALNALLASGRPFDDRKKGTGHGRGKDDAKGSRSDSVLSVDIVRHMADQISSSTKAKKIINASSYKIENVMEILTQIVRSSSEDTIAYVVDTKPKIKL